MKMDTTRVEEAIRVLLSFGDEDAERLMDLEERRKQLNQQRQAVAKESKTNSKEMKRIFRKARGRLNQFNRMMDIARCSASVLRAMSSVSCSEFKRRIKQCLCGSQLELASYYNCALFCPAELVAHRGAVVVAAACYFGPLRTFISYVSVCLHSHVSNSKPPTHRAMCAACLVERNSRNDVSVINDGP